MLVRNRQLSRIGVQYVGVGGSNPSHISQIYEDPDSRALPQSRRNRARRRARRLVEQDYDLRVTTGVHPLGWRPSASTGLFVSRVNPCSSLSPRVWRTPRRRLSMHRYIRSWSGSPDRYCTTHKNIFLRDILVLQCVAVSLTETWDDVNEHVKTEWKDDTTPFERVYDIVEQTHEGQSAAEIADRALVSEPTARRHCKALVNTGHLFANAPDGSPDLRRPVARLRYSTVSARRTNHLFRLYARYQRYVDGSCEWCVRYYVSRSKRSAVPRVPLH